MIISHFVDHFFFLLFVSLFLFPDQKTVQPTAAPMAPVPFSPAGQSFAPVSQPRHGHTTPRTPSAQTNRPARGEQAREEREERGNEGQRAKYPTEREPGEGIDSEHITPFGSTDSDKTKRAGERGKGEERKRETRRGRVGSRWLHPWKGCFHQGQKLTQHTELSF